MRLALEEAAKAAREGEIPIGAVLTDGNGKPVVATHNLTETRHSATAHAELLAIAEACRQRSAKWLSDCTLYVTLEPCPMCAGAIVATRIPRVVYGAKDPRAGAFGSLVNLAELPLESKPEIVSGVLAEDCLAPIRAFFSQKRNQSDREKPVDLKTKEPRENGENGETHE